LLRNLIATAWPGAILHCGEASSDRSGVLTLHRQLAVLFAVSTIAVLSSSCHRVPSPQVTLPSELIVPEGATEVRPQRRPDGGVEVLYRIGQPYPAEGLLAQVHTALPRERWEPLTEDWLNPGMPTSHKMGWQSNINGMRSPNTLIHSWSAQWKDAQGNIVLYGLVYDSKYNSALPLFRQLPDNSRLEVAAAWIPASIAKAMLDAFSAAAKQTR
jgi:hypothetical protein